MVLTIPGRQTVTVVCRTRAVDTSGAWARDGRGDAVYEDMRVVVPGCSVQPAGVNAERDTSGGTAVGREQVSTMWTIYAPSSWPSDATAAVEIGGHSYEVLGTPQRWSHPRLDHVVVTVRRTEG